MTGFIASDLADRPWIPITVAVVFLACVVIAVWRSAWVALAAIIGGLLGAVAFLPVGNKVLDGPPDCRSCGEYITVLIGADFRVPYNGPRAAAFGAAVVGTVFALGTWGLLRFTHRLQCSVPGCPRIGLRISQRGQAFSA